MKRNNIHGKQSKVESYTVQEPMELLQFLLTVLANRSRNSVKSILARGQVLVDDKPETAFNYQLRPGQTIDIRKFKVVEKQKLEGLIILHEDEDIIIVNKESGLLSIASEKEKQKTAYRQLMNHVRVQHPKNRVYIVHRLDKDTSGVMLFAKNEQIKYKLQNSWKKIVQERKYVALVEGTVKKQSGTISSYLVESGTHKMYSKQFDKNGKQAVTHYRVIQSNKQCSLLEVVLETGRKNQIRVHMEDIGHPIVGDKKYGSKLNLIGRLGLHAQVLAFKHPSTGKLLRFKAEVPKNFISRSK